MIHFVRTHCTISLYTIVAPLEPRPHCSIHTHTRCCKLRRRPARRCTTFHHTRRAVAYVVPRNNVFCDPTLCPTYAAPRRAMRSYAPRGHDTPRATAGGRAPRPETKARDRRPRAEASSTQWFQNKRNPGRKNVNRQTRERPTTLAQTRRRSHT